MKYKCIPAPEVIKIEKGWNIVERMTNKEKAVRSFADLINKETSNGWKFHSMESIAITEEPGCFSALFGRKSETTYFNMLVFSNENESAISEDQDVKSSYTEKHLPGRSNQKIDYVVVKSINLRSLPNLSVSSVIKPLSEGVELTLLEKGENIIIDNIQAPWVKVQDENNNIGWCFSGYLKEI